MKLMGKITIKELLSQAKSLARLFLGKMSVFVLLAAIMWLLNALNKNYTADIIFPVKYINLPQDRIVSNPEQDEVRLKLSGTGYSLLQQTATMAKQPVILDMSVIARHRDNNRNANYILTRQALEYVNNLFGNDLNLIEIKPDTLWLDYSLLKTRRIAVKPDISITYKKEYLPKSEPVITPDTIEVKGPANVLDTISYIYTDIIKYRNVQNPVKAQANIKKTHNSLQYSVDKVQVYIPVERYTEASVEIPVTPVNFPAGFTVKLFPVSVSLSCMVGINDYDSLKPSDFKIIVDYNKADGESKLRAQLTEHPTHIINAVFQPQLVEFIMEK